jgi:hypothetical protein
MAGLFSDFQPIRRVASNQYGTAWRTLTKGSLISFEYPKSFAMIPNIIHDPRPMLIITDIFSPNYIRGLNLHYLTFNYVKRILQAHSGNASFSYSNIRPDNYMVTAFRMYNLKGVIRPKRLDSEWLKTVLASVRTFDIGELEKIRSTIEQQIQSRLQVRANELTAYEEYIKGLNRSQKSQFQTRVSGVEDALTGGIQRNLVYPDTSNKNTNQTTDIQQD